MSYIEEFLDSNSNLPRDTIRILKLMREIDEKSVNSQKKLSDLRGELKILYKSKNRNEKNEQDLIKQIEKDYNNSLNLNDHKLELINEINYICEFHLKKLNELIENSEKNIQAANIQQGFAPIIPYDYKAGDLGSSVMGDDISLTGSKKKADTLSSKTTKDIQAAMVPTSITLLKKKKSRPSKSSRKDKELDDELTQNISEPIIYDLEKQENEPLYCFCNGVSYGDMIKCDNDTCKREWFHMPCVNLEITPKGKWYCSEECAIKGKKRRR